MTAPAFDSLWGEDSFDDLWGDDAPKPGVGTKIFGTIAATGRDIPGVEAAQGAARAVVREGGWRDVVRALGAGEGAGGALLRVLKSPEYRTARNDIREAEGAAPAVARNVARFGGAALGAMAMPGGPIAQGATYGGLHGLLDSDPDKDAADRASDAMAGGAYGAAGGAVVGGLGRLVRGAQKLPPGTLGDAARKVFPKTGRAVDTIRSARDATVVRPQVRLGQASAPKAEGFVGNSMDNVLEAVKANRPDPNAAARFEALDLDGKLKDLLARSEIGLPRTPGRHAPQFSDAEIAMGLDLPEQNIMGALEESLKHVQRGGKLSQVRTGGPARVP